MALAERIVLTPKYPGRKVRLHSQGRELKAALDETKLLLKDHRQQCLRIMDLSTSPSFQPVFIKFWQLFLQLRQQGEFVSGESGRCTLPADVYLGAMELIKKALGSALATCDHLQQLHGLDTEVSYKRFCYDVVCCLGDGVLDISSERFESMLRKVFKECTRVVDLRVELKDVDEITPLFTSPLPVEAATPTIKLPSLIETITRMTGTSEDLIIGRRPRTTSKPRPPVTGFPVPPKTQQTATREEQVLKVNLLRREVGSGGENSSAVTIHSLLSPGMQPRYTPRAEFTAPATSGAMFISLRNESTSRKVMTKKTIRFAFPRPSHSNDSRGLKLKGRKVRVVSVPPNLRDSMSKGQQVTIESNLELEALRSAEYSKGESTSSSRLKPRLEDSKKARTPLNVVVMEM